MILLYIIDKIRAEMFKYFRQKGLFNVPFMHRTSLESGGLY